MRILLLIGLVLCSICTRAQTADTIYLLTADRVFDGEAMHNQWAVLIKADKIVAVGEKKSLDIPANAKRLDFPGCTILPGLIEGHAHLLLYPYNRKSWDDQVLKESDALRVLRGAKQVEATLKAGFTTVRDLGSEGAGYADVALRQAIDAGWYAGPRLQVAGRAIVATGSYGPKGYDNDSKIMLGAEEADGNDAVRVVRSQIGQGIDWVKIYADYHWGPNRQSLPTFLLEEMKAMVAAAKSAGRPVAAHAGTAEGVKRAVLAGVETIEHGDELDDEDIALMKEYKVTYFPTLAASESIRQYRGWRKGTDPEPVDITAKKISFRKALNAGIKIGMGGDVGVFAHGNNVLEMELMQEYGMPAIDVLRSATAVNAAALHLENTTGKLQKGLQADVLVVMGDPSKQVSDCRKVKLVVKGGRIVP
ncbi:MAG TPA: amidohydrolase family protein [Flavihumibacter sp.]|nr:amidohydrolase family protein [Flavihumibacter sp.]HPZ86703.1 amidohydrolase family protein [Flavihumibacter sp.]HQD08025.1 amidohydrolase family protein [Flavihumibacter sp.]